MIASQHLLQASVRLGRESVVTSADELTIDEDLRHGALARVLSQHALQRDSVAMLVQLQHGGILAQLAEQILHLQRSYRGEESASARCKRDAYTTRATDVRVTYTGAEGTVRLAEDGDLVVEDQLVDDVLMVRHG